MNKTDNIERLELLKNYIKRIYGNEFNHIVDEIDRNIALDNNHNEINSTCDLLLITKDLIDAVEKIWLLTSKPKLTIH